MMPIPTEDYTGKELEDKIIINKKKKIDMKTNLKDLQAS